MTRKKILIVTKGLDLGGVERVVVDLAVGLQRRGQPVEVAVVNSDRDALASQLERAGVWIHRLEGTDMIGIRGMWRLARLCRDQRFGVIHVHGPLPAIVVRLIPGTPPIVTTSHTPWTSLHQLTRRTWRATMRRDAVMVAVSNGVARSLPHQGRQTPHIIPHGIDTDAAAVARQIPGERDTSSTVRVVTVASHRDAKNYPNLIRSVKVALDLGADITLTAIGAGAGLADHERLVAELGLTEFVSFERPTVDILPRIAEHDLLVVASDYEGQPLVVTEAFAVGLPVVATNVGRVPELIDASVGQIVPTQDADALGAAIAALANDPERRCAMSANALLAATKWSLDDAIDAYLAIYESIG